MKLNKKILLNSSIIPLAVASPIAIAVSCSISVVNNKVILKDTNKNVQVYSTKSIEQLDDFFKGFINKFDVKGLKKQALRTTDAALIAFGGYLVDVEKEGPVKAKKIFGKNIGILKFELDKLFDDAIGDPKSSMNVISPILKNYIKDQKIQNLANIVVQNVFKKIKMVMDNVIDTIKNVKSPSTPNFMKDTTRIGTLEDIKNHKNKTISYESIVKGFEAGFDEKTVLFKRPEGTYDALHEYGGGWVNFRKNSIEFALGTNLKFKKDAQEIKGTAWQVGVNSLKKDVLNNAKNIVVFKDEKTNKIFLKKKTTTTQLANEIKSNLKFNEKHIASLINDKLINESRTLLEKVVKGEIGLTSLLGEIGHVKKILKNKDAIYTFIDRAQLILEDFGKTMQFTELNLQMITSHLLGDDAQYYGGLKINNGGKYTLLPETFTTPQFNIYNYKNYKPYNETVSQGTLDKGFKVTVSLGASITIKVLEVFHEITRDPLSNYTVGLFQIFQLLTKDMEDMKIGI